MVKTSLRICGVTTWTRQKIILQVFNSFCKPNPHNSSCCRPNSSQKILKYVLNCKPLGRSYSFQVFWGRWPISVKRLTVGRTRAATFMCIGFHNVFCRSYFSWFNLANKLQRGNICAACLLLCELFILSQGRKQCFKSFNQQNVWKILCVLCGFQRVFLFRSCITSSII